jgi:hypothetical protein
MNQLEECHLREREAEKQDTIAALEEARHGRLAPLRPSFALARGGAYCFCGGGNGSRTGSGLILARIAFRVLTRGDMK